MYAYHPSFRDQLRIGQEPRDLLTRYFNALDMEARARAIEFHLVSPHDLVAVHEAHADSWNGFTPVFDPRKTTISDDDCACILGFDRRGKPALAHACRLFDFGTGSVKDALEDLSFWYGDRAYQWRAGTRCVVTAPSAARLTGRMLYIGAFWVRPDLRSQIVGQTMQELSRIYGCARWAFDTIVTVGSRALMRPDLQARYGFDGYEEKFEISTGDGQRFDGLFIWQTRASQMARLQRMIGGWEREAAGLGAPRRLG